MPFRLSHLNADYDFRDDPWDFRYEWSATPELDEYDRPTIVARLNCLRISAPKIPFGFRIGESRFEDVGNGTYVYRPADPSEGLTCTTYADLVFRSLGFPVVNVSTWPQRDSDETWRQAMIRYMTMHGLNPDRVQMVAKAQRDARVRPEEFVSAFVQPDWAVTFQRIQAIVQHVIDDLETALQDPPVVPLIR